MIKPKETIFTKALKRLITEGKQCSCGKWHYSLPVKAQFMHGGFWWNCDCKSTLFRKVG